MGAPRRGPGRLKPVGGPPLRSLGDGYQRAGGEQVRCFSDKCLVILKAVCDLTYGYISLQKGCN